MSVTRPSDEHLIVRGVVTLLVGVVVLWTLYSIRGALLVIYVSGLLALGFSPIIRTLERQHLMGAGRLPRWIAILVVYFGVLGAIAMAIALIMPPLVQQATQLWHDLPGHILALQRILVQHRILDHQWTLEEVLKALPGPGATLAVIVGALQSVIGTIGTLVVIIVLPYYLLVEADSVQEGFLKLFPQDRRGWIARMIHDVTTKVGAWLNGQLLLSAIIGITASIGLWLMGVPYFYVLGLIAAAGEFVPIIGPIVAAVPAVLLGLTQSVHTAVFVIIYFSVQQFIEGNILVPKVMQRQVGVSAWSVLVALLIGSELLGVVGAILAVPSAAIVQVFLQEVLGPGQGVRGVTSGVVRDVKTYVVRGVRMGVVQGVRSGRRPGRQDRRRPGRQEHCHPRCILQGCGRIPRLPVFRARRPAGSGSLPAPQSARRTATIPHALRRQGRRQSVVQQLPGIDDASEARRERARSHTGAGCRHRLGPDHRRHDDDSHGIGAATGRVQEVRGCRRVPERVHGECRNRVLDSHERRLHHFRRAESRQHHRRRTAEPRHD